MGGTETSSSISDIHLECLGNERRNYRIDIVRKNIDGFPVFFPLSREASGTKKMVSLYLFIVTAIENGTLLLFDELNSKLHPLLLRNLLTVFANHRKNTQHAQIVFTCHEPWLLRANILRRDEIFFTRKDPTKGEAELYSLADFVDSKGNRIRSDEDYEKNYLLGKYDGIPTLGPLDFGVGTEKENRQNKGEWE